MLKSLPLECAEPSVNDGLDSEATEWLSCEKQKKLDKTSNAIQGKKRKHKQVLPKQLDNLASVDAGRGRRSINSGFLSTASSVSSRSLTQSKLTAFFKQAPKTLPSHRSDKCTENEDHSCDYSSSSNIDSTSLQNKESSTMIEGNILRNFSSYQSDNGSDSSLSYRSPKISNEEQMEFSSQNWIQPCIKDRENLNFFSADSDGDSPANDCYSQVSEAACQKDFDNNIAEIAHPPSPLIFSQWTEDNVDYI